MSNTEKKTVYFDGSCVLCRSEISFYKTCAGASHVEWVDVSRATQQELGPDLTQADAMARFHVRDENLQLVSGGAAFTELWSALVMFRPLAFVFRMSGLRTLLEWCYSGFLRVRPGLQRVVASRHAKNKARVS